MKVQLTLYTSFLQTRFPVTREVLQGSHQIEEVVIFAADQPASAPTSFQVVPPGLREDPKKATKLPKLKLPKPQFPTKFVQHALTGVIAIAILLVAIVLAPDLYYRVFPAETVPIQAAQDGTPIGGSFDRNGQAGAAQPQAEPSPTPRPLPPQDPTLPEGTWLVIPRIGIRTQPVVSEDPEVALKDGVWQVPGYGEPGDTNMPLILAAHRYGWQWWWKTDYWKYHSFYLLPDLEPGDIVEVIHDQRKYYYEIYAGEEGEDITDYSADMILYTCKFLNSPLRHFRYARLVDMRTNTQTLE